MSIEGTSIGEARRQIAKLQKIREQWRSTMNALVREYNAEFTDPPITLRVHSQYWAFSLRWRRRGKGSKDLGQSAFIMASERGRSVLEALPRPARRRILDYDRRAVNMNLQANIAAYTEDRLRLYLRHIETLDAWHTELGI